MRGSLQQFSTAGSAAMMPRPFPLSQDGRQKQCAATSPEANSSSPFWWIFTWETVVRRKIWGWNTVRGQAAYHKAVLPSTNYKLKSHSHFYSWVCAGMYVIMMPNSLRELGLWGWSCGRNADFPQLFTWLTPFRLGVSSSIAFPDVFLLSYQKHAICHTLNSTLFTSYRHLSMG